MIAGTGIDVVDCAAFEALLREPGSAFEERTFTAAELMLLTDAASIDDVLAF